VSVRHRRRSDRGLSLVEVVVAVGVLSIILLGLMASFASAQRADLLTREHQAASEAAFKQMDTLLMNPNFDAVPTKGHFHVQFKSTGGAVNLKPAETPPAGYEVPVDGSGDATLETGHYTALQMTATNGFSGDQLLGADCMQLSVTVAWRGADGSDQRVDLVTMRVR
jgi:prepilin-type N-terminal cleavage/methylation domain-containing protein